MLIPALALAAKRYHDEVDAIKAKVKAQKAAELKAKRADKAGGHNKLSKELNGGSLAPLFAVLFNCAWQYCLGSSADTRITTKFVPRRSFPCHVYS